MHRHARPAIHVPRHHALLLVDQLQVSAQAELLLFPRQAAEERVRGEAPFHRERVGARHWYVRRAVAVGVVGVAGVVAVVGFGEVDVDVGREGLEAGGPDQVVCGLEGVAAGRVGDAVYAVVWRRVVGRRRFVVAGWRRRRRRVCRCCWLSLCMSVSDVGVPGDDDLRFAIFRRLDCVEQLAIPRRGDGIGHPGL